MLVKFPINHLHINNARIASLHPLVEITAAIELFLRRHVQRIDANG